MEEKNAKDLSFIQDVAQELGLSPLDIFMHWWEIGKVKKLAVKITYEDGNVAELDLAKLGFVTGQNESQPQTVTPCGASSKRKQDEPLYIERPFEEVEAKNSGNKEESSAVGTSETVTVEISESEGLTEAQPQDFQDENILPTTSIKHGRICIKDEQKQNVKVGAYVYTTGDILSTKNMLTHVNVRGIILSYSTESITMVKYLGSNMTAVQSSAQICDGWRFLTYKECQRIANYKNILNVSLIGLKRKQIDDTSMLLYRDNDNELYGYNVASRQVHKSLNDKKVIKERAFAVFLAKDLRIV